ncbi:MAG: glycosyltransferase [Bacteroidaceae bacterium]|nr:glycosyltransferase [Bacteroidaceae bacterium]
MDNNICVIIVTYNRLTKLKKALQSYAQQTYKPSSIIVVDNCSTDGTEDFLNEWASDNQMISKRVIRTDRNLGGAGGFRIGFKAALETDADWLWVSDDDAYPQPDSLQIVNENANKTEYGKVACFCGAVCTRSLENISVTHRRYSVKKLIYVPKPVPKEEYSHPAIEIQETTFVGSCYNMDILRKTPLPNDQLFIFYDDTEHSHRINKYGKIILLPNMRIFHDTAVAKLKPNVVTTWRDYYLTRNHVYTLKSYHLLTFLFFCCYKVVKELHEYKCHKSAKALKMQFIAIYDGIRGKLGVHKLYKPGFEICR